MWRLKSCPRCRGDMQIDHDHRGWYEWCLQCGYQHELKTGAGITSPAPDGKQVTRVA
ncbi:MAG: hypothetical protein ABID71_04380 [Chloroflexota bacterium]